MSKEYENQDPLEIAKQAEKDLNSTQMKEGQSNMKGASDSTNVSRSSSNHYEGTH
jgi:hypothetical protein